MSGSARPRKRDLVRNLITRSQPSGSHSSTTQLATPHPTKVTSASSIVLPQTGPLNASQKFLAATLTKLTTDEQRILRAHLAPDTQDVSTAVDQVYGAALRKKQICEDKRWRWTFRNKDILLRDEAQKVLGWLDRFKSVGDVIANVDPVYIGLPWAGFRILLEVLSRPTWMYQKVCMSYLNRRWRLPKAIRWPLL